MGSSKLYYIVSVDHGSTSHRSDCEGSDAVDGNDDDMLWNDSED
jgi:hypothetical protein